MNGFSVAVPGPDRRLRRGGSKVGEGMLGEGSAVELARDGHQNNKGQRGR